MAKWNMPDEADEIARLRDEIDRLRAALHQCADWFDQYGEGHAAKGDTDKAKRNFDRRDYARRAALGSAS